MLDYVLAWRARPAPNYAHLISDFFEKMISRALIDAYLSAEHRDHPGSGCMVSALGGEVARGDRKLRIGFAKATTMGLNRISPYFPGATSAERFQNAGVLMASMAGVLMVSRVLPDTAQSDALLAGARKRFCAMFLDT